MRRIHWAWQRIPQALLLVPVLILCTCAVKPSAPPINAASIEQQVKAVLELPTYEYVYRDIIYIAEQAEFLGFRHTDKQLLFAVDVRLQAGVDLTKGIEIKVENAHEITLTLPNPEILLIDADESSISQYFKKEFGGEISRLEYYDEISRSKEQIRQDAIENGVLAKAEDNAASILRSLLQQQGVDTVHISFRKPSKGGSL